MKRVLFILLLLGCRGPEPLPPPTLNDAALEEPDAALEESDASIEEYDAAIPEEEEIVRDIFLREDDGVWEEPWWPEEPFWTDEEMEILRRFDPGRLPPEPAEAEFDLDDPFEEWTSDYDWG